MIKFVSSNDMSLEENFEKACEMIDIDSFIDYYAVQLYITRSADWPKSNFALWRTRSTDGGMYSDGRWRWMLFDDNFYVFRSKFVHDPMIKRIKEYDKVFAGMMANKGIEHRFIQTLRELAVDTFNPERVHAFLADYKAVMSDPLRKEYARFYGSDNTLYKDKFLSRLEAIETFLTERHDFILKYCDKYLAGSPQPLDNAEGGN
jgi:hypothetical protein